MLKTITSVLRLLAWPVTVGIVAIIALVALSRLENDLRSALFALCGIGLLAALLLVASRRIAFSVYSALALGLLVAAPLLMVPLALPGWASEGSYLFQGRHISALMVSLRELPELWADHPLTARAKLVVGVEPHRLRRSRITVLRPARWSHRSGWMRRFLAIG